MTACLDSRLGLFFSCHTLPITLQLTAQMETWASHFSVHNFWGVAEQQDYDVNCDQQSLEALQTYRQSCKDPNVKTYPGFPGFGAEQYAKSCWGWFCAQRRPGHALGWLQKMYQNEANIPDILMIVEDDTTVDIEEVQRQMSRVQDGPFVGNPIIIPVLMLGLTGVGGAGTFFNRAALEHLSRPIFCDDRQQDDMHAACENLHANRFGEYDVFQQGDSAFDLFFKYAGLRDFCMHSD